MLKFVAVIYHAATPIALDNAHCKKKSGVANPSLPVIAQLRKDGIARGHAAGFNRYQCAGHVVPAAMPRLPRATSAWRRGSNAPANRGHVGCDR